MIGRNDIARSVGLACVAVLLSASAQAQSVNYRFGAGQDRVVSDEVHGYTQHVAPDFEVQDGIAVTYVRLGRARVARLVSTSYAAKVYTDVAPLDGVDGKIAAGDAWISQQASTGALSLAVTPTAVERLLLSSARRILYESVPTTVYFAHDQLGSMTVDTDDAGAVIGRRGYTPFGAVASSTGDADRYGFTGQEHEATGLVHFEFRELDPVIGRWASPDPLFAAADESAAEDVGEGTTAYAYVANSPFNFIDSTGLRLIWVAGGNTDYRRPSKAYAEAAERLARMEAVNVENRDVPTFTAARVIWHNGTEHQVITTNLVRSQMTGEHRDYMQRLASRGIHVFSPSNFGEHAEDVLHEMATGIGYRGGVSQVVATTYGRRGLKRMCEDCQDRAAHRNLDFVVHGSGVYEEGESHEQGVLGRAPTHLRVAPASHSNVDVKSSSKSNGGSKTR
jgi:RHS repeat-associated protein